jgi:hypothetical protein
MNLTFNQFLEQRDPELYNQMLNEGVFGDAWQGMKNIWNSLLFKQAVANVGTSMQSVGDPEQLLNQIRMITKKYQLYWDAPKLAKHFANDAPEMEMYKQAPQKKAEVAILLDKLAKYLKTDTGMAWGMKNGFKKGFTAESVERKTGAKIQTFKTVVKKAASFGIILATLGALLVGFAGDGEAPVSHDNTSGQSSSVGGGPDVGPDIGPDPDADPYSSVPPIPPMEDDSEVGGQNSRFGDKMAVFKSPVKSPVRDKLFGQKTQVGPDGEEENARRTPLRTGAKNMVDRIKYRIGR